MKEEKQYPDHVYMYHTIKVGKTDVFSINIAICKPKVVIVDNKEQTIAEWKIASFANNSTGRLYYPEDDKVLTDHITAILRKELHIDTEELYYQTVNMP